MSRLSASNRGQVEPLAALVAVFAVCVGLSMYAFVATDALPEDERSLAAPTLEQVESSTNGSIRPSRMTTVVEQVGPSGAAVALTLETRGHTWHFGPQAPSNADQATTPASIRVKQGVVRTGTLTVEVWNV